MIALWRSLPFVMAGLGLYLLALYAVIHPWLVLVVAALTLVALTAWFEHDFRKQS
jgi:hypothetical protein